MNIKEKDIKRICEFATNYTPIGSLERREAEELAFKLIEYSKPAVMLKKQFKDIDVKKLRTDAKMPQSEVSEQTELTIATLSRIENGHNQVSPDNLEKILDALGLEIVYLIKEKEVK